LFSVLDEFRKAYKEFYPNGAKGLADFSRIVNKDYFRRLRSMLKNTRGKILMGGTMDKDELFIEPTVVQVSLINDSMCSQESFGLFIPILPVDSLDQAIELANGLMSTPLNLYPFGNKLEIEHSSFSTSNIDIFHHF
jgi:beta-apo-4'-carotenal oxygenase